MSADEECSGPPHEFRAYNADDPFATFGFCDVCSTGFRHRQPLPVTPTHEQCVAWRNELDAWQDEPYTPPSDHYFAVIYNIAWTEALSQVDAGFDRYVGSLENAGNDPWRRDVANQIRAEVLPPADAS